MQNSVCIFSSNCKYWNSSKGFFSKICHCTKKFSSKIGMSVPRCFSWFFLQRSQLCPSAYPKFPESPEQFFGPGRSFVSIFVGFVLQFRGFSSCKRCQRDPRGGLSKNTNGPLVFNAETSPQSPKIIKNRKILKIFLLKMQFNQYPLFLMLTTTLFPNNILFLFQSILGSNICTPREKLVFSNCYYP